MGVRLYPSLLAALIVAALPVTVVHAQATPDVGAKLYQAKCGACHAIMGNKIGPAHRGLIGRTAGTYPGYKYSEVLKASKIVWTAATLDRWLQGPQKMAKGSKMFYTLPSAADRAAIIAYLSSPAGR